jgi:chemotaxis protein methyltransferase CheR
MEHQATLIGAAILSALKKLPGFRRVLQTDRFKRLRYEVVLAFQKRRNYVFTQFLRVPTQFDALVGPVVDFLVQGNDASSLSITVWGCSNGAEPYSIGSALLSRRPRLDFTVQAFDIDEQMLERARGGTYTYAEVFRNKALDPAFVEETFSRQGDLYKVNQAVMKRVSFDAMNVFDMDLDSGIGRSDIIFAQNILYHLKPKATTSAFGNICRLMKPKAALFVDGMDLGLKTKLTKAHDLEPLDYRIAEIHNEARRERGSAWPYEYWGLEPFSESRRDWKRRYATIFLLNDTPRSTLNPQSQAKQWHHASFEERSPLG